MRDRMGEEPLFYREDGSFSSEIRDLVGTDPEADTTGIYLFLSMGYPYHPWTSVKGIRQLGPGERLVSHGDTVAAERYWDLWPPSASPDIPDDAWPDLLMERTKASIRRSLDAASRKGASSPFIFLSGGIDSALLAALLLDVEPSAGRALTLGPKGESDREVLRAGRTAEVFGMEHRVVVPSIESVRRLPRALSRLSNPCPAHEALMILLLTEGAARAGWTHGLWGMGSEMATGTLPRHRWAYRLLRLGSIPGVHLASPLEAAVGRISPRRGRRLGFFLRKESFSEKYRRFFFQSHFDDATERLFRKEVREKARRETASPAWAAFLNDSRSCDLVERMIRVDMLHTFAPKLQREIRDIGAAAGVSPILPFFDPEDLPLYQAIPLRLRRRSGWKKWIFREAARRRLPPEALDNPASSSVFPIEEWFGVSTDEPLARLVSDGALLPRIVDPAGLREALAIHPNPDRIRFNLFALEAWWRLLTGEAAETDALDEMLGFSLE